MKQHIRLLALVLAALATPLFPQHASAEVEVSFDYFQDALSPFGEWIEVGDYGPCWRPTGVAEDWAPYTDGYWAYTDAGWTWVSYEDWGGITYHYGRWVHVVDEGWVWVPEYEWGPAWVSWRSNDEYVGWAPLPPEARWEESTGFSVWVDTSYDIGPDSYRFCHTNDFGAPVLAPLLLPCGRNVTIIENTVNITNITFIRDSSLIFCGGPNFNGINRQLRRPIPSLKLVREDHTVRDTHGHAPPQVVRGNLLAVYAPKVARPADLKALPITPRRIVGADKINRGWSRVPDLAMQEQIKQKLQKQSEGVAPRTAPARPVRPEELSNVPKKAEPNAPSPGVVVRDRRAPERTAVRPAVSPEPGQPQRPAPGIVSPRVGTTPALEQFQPGANPPNAREHPVLMKPFNNPPAQKPGREPQPDPRPRAPQVAGPDETAPASQADRARVQREEIARRDAAARQQQEKAAAQRAEDARRDQAGQERQQARQAEAVLRQQEAAQRAGEIRRQEMQQNEAARQQQQAAQRAIEIRNQQAQQTEVVRQRQEAAVERANATHHQQQTQRPEPPHREQVTPQSHPAAQPQSSQPAAKDGDDDKKKHRSGR